jgi:hypothetical protein
MPHRQQTPHEAPGCRDERRGASRSGHALVPSEGADPGPASDGADPGPPAPNPDFMLVTVKSSSIITVTMLQLVTGPRCACEPTMSRKTK